MQVEYYDTKHPEEGPWQVHTNACAYPRTYQIYQRVESP